MFFKESDTICRQIDLSDTQSGSCILVGSSPGLKDLPLEDIERSKIPIIAINNAATVIKPTYWISMDHPSCFSKLILYDPTIIKFANAGHRLKEIDGKKWRDFPNTFFYQASEKDWDNNNFLFRRKEFIYWRATFYVAIQLAYRLGFRKIYLAGCEFSIKDYYQYAFESNLSPKEIELNSTLYKQIIAKMIDLKPHFRECGLEIKSLDWHTNLYVPKVKWDDIKYEELSKLPAKIESTKELPHSLTNYEQTRTSTSNSKPA